MIMRIQLFVVFFLFFISPLLKGQESTSRYDYSEVARAITKGRDTNLEKAEAIYEWLCENISYDTSYSIYTADECFDHRKGVCQAYCELYKEIAACVGLEVEIIAGDTNPNTASSGRDRRHAWLFVLTDGNSGILVDPTWGAGSVNNGVFKKSDRDKSWFWVDPYWMIFTHYPDDEAYQFLSTPLSHDDFVRLPFLRPSLADLGFIGEDLLIGILSGEICSMPKLYGAKPGTVLLEELPLQEELRVGEMYDFKLQPLKDAKFALIENKEFHEDWAVSGTIWSMRYMPTEAGELSLGVHLADGKYQTIVSYRIAKPTARELANVERVDPFASREIKELAKDTRVLKKYGVDGSDLLKKIRKGQVKSLPLFYDKDDFQYQIVDIPLNGALKVGETYQFVIKCDPSRKTAIVNGQTWSMDWEHKDQDIRYLAVTPTSKGTLRLLMQGADGSYYVMIDYQVR